MSSFIVSLGFNFPAIETHEIHVLNYKNSKLKPEFLGLKLQQHWSNF